MKDNKPLFEVTKLGGSFYARVNHLNQEGEKWFGIYVTAV